MIYYRQTWFDPRLKFDLNYSLVIQGDMLDDIWIPDTFFTNEKTSLVHQVTKDNYMLIMMPNGTIFFSLRYERVVTIPTPSIKSLRTITCSLCNVTMLCDRISITAICPMDLRKYPMDSQVCRLDVMSCELHCYPLYCTCWRMYILPSNPLQT